MNGLGAPRRPISISREPTGKNKPRSSAKIRYPLGLRAMGKNVERAIRGSMEQGLLTKLLRLEDIYYRTTLNT